MKAKLKNYLKIGAMLTPIFMSIRFAEGSFHHVYNYLDEELKDDSSEMTIYMAKAISAFLGMLIWIAIWPALIIIEIIKFITK